MIDVQVLRGAMVRSSDGRQGRIGKVSMPWVRIEWQQGEATDVDSRAYRRGAADVHENFEVLTLDRGWLGMGEILGSRPRGRLAGLIDDLQTALEGCGCGCTDGSCKKDSVLQTPPKSRAFPRRAGTNLGAAVEQTEAVQSLMRKVIAERSARHYPFKRKSKLGPGPRKGTNAKANQWDCSCKNYVCGCTGKEGQKKRVVIDRAYKAAYNREYRAWLAKQG